MNQYEVFSGPGEFGPEILSTDGHGKWTITIDCFTLDGHPISPDNPLVLIHTNYIHPQRDPKITARIGKNRIEREVTIQEAAKFAIRHQVAPELKDYLSRLVAADESSPSS